METTVPRTSTMNWWVVRKRLERAWLWLAHPAQYERDRANGYFKKGYFYDD